MSTLYIKNNIIKTREKIVIFKDKMQIFNPKEQQLFEDGWEIYIPPIIQAPIEIPIEEQYKQRVIELIRRRYSVDDELAILRQRNSKIDEFNVYNSFVEECKVTARREFDI